MIITTQDISPHVLEITASLATSPRVEASTAVPKTTPSVFNSEPEATPSLAPSSVVEMSPLVPTVTASPGESETTASWVSHPAWISPTPNVPHSELATTTSIATSLEAKDRPAVPIPTVSTGVPDMVISLVTSSETKNVMAIPIMTDSPGQPGTRASMAPHTGTEASSTVLTSSVTSGVMGMVTSLTPSSGAETSPAVQTLIASPGEPETTVSWATHPADTSPSVSRTTPSVSHGELDTTTATSPGTERSSGNPISTVSPGIPGMVTSPVISSGTKTSMAISTLTDSLYEPETAALLATHPRTEDNSAVPTHTGSLSGSWIVTSLVTSSGTETSKIVPVLTASHGEPERTASLATNLETEETSAIPTMSVSPGILGMVTLLVTSSGTKTSMAIPTVTDSPDQPETTASSASSAITTLTPSSRAETSPGVQTLTASPGEPKTTATWVTHPAETNLTVSRTNPSASHSESETTSSVDTSPGTKASSTIPTMTVSLGISDMMTSWVTNSGAESSLAVPTLSDSPGKPETTALQSTHPGSETSSTISAPAVSPGVSEMITSPHSSSRSETSTLFATLIDYTHELPAKPSLTTFPETKYGPAVPPVTASPGALDLATSVVTSFETETGTTIPIMTETTTSLPIHPGTEDSLTFPSTASPRTLDLVSSVVTGLETEVNTTISITTASSHEPETIVLLATHPTAETNTTIHDSTVSPLTTIRSGVEISTALSAQTVSLGAVETTSSLFTVPGTETSRDDVAPTTSPRVTIETTSLFTHPETEASTVPPSTLSTSVQGPATDFATASTLASWGPETSLPPTSVELPEFSKSVTRATAALVPSEATTPSETSHGKEESPTIILTTATIETTHLATGSGLPVSVTPATSETLDRSPFAALPTSGMSTWASVSVASGTTAVPFLMPFTLNFTITNLYYTEDMGHPDSEVFNITEGALQQQLRNLLTNSSVGSLYSGCRLTLLRADKNKASTRMNAVCSYYSDPTGFVLDREQLYWELSQLTFGITQLGPFTLEKNTLYINGYNYPQWTHSTSTVGMSSALVPFTLNFTITNLLYTPNMGQLGSREFNSTEQVLNQLLKSVFMNTSIGPLYSGCRLTLLRIENDGAATGVDAVCTYYSGPMGSGLGREQLYQELSQHTYGVTQLGPYTLDRNSLYVNGYNHQYQIPTTSTPVTSTFSSRPSTSLYHNPSSTGPSLVPFTISFTITSLYYTEDMGSPDSELFNTTERLLNSLLSSLFQNSSIGHLYSGCALTLLRPEKDGSAVGVDIVCTLRSDPAGPGLDREQLYWELNHETFNVTQLGPFTLDEDSLFVNGYTYRASTSTPTATGPTLVPFTLNFTITNLYYMEDMHHPGSAKYNTVERSLNLLIGHLFSNTSLSSLYYGCRLTLLRSEKDGEATGVDAICTLLADSAGPGLDREQLYWELSQLTHGVTQLGPYTLDQDSLYVNGYTHQALATTSIPAGPHLVPFTLNFTITNLRSVEDMQLESTIFNSTESFLQSLLKVLFTTSSIGPHYTGCRLTIRRPEKNGTATGVDGVCTYRPDHAGSQLDRELLYWELSNQTNGVTQLGPYTLDRDHLYVDGYTRPASISNPTAAGLALVPFTLNFTITNLNHMEDMGDPASSAFHAFEMFLQRLLLPLFKNTSIGPLYSGCRITSLRYEKDREAATVNALCTRRPDPLGTGLDTEWLYWELSQLTRGVTQLGPFTLDRDKLIVNGYTHQISKPTSNATGPSLVPFTLNFTITNLRYTADMWPPGSIAFITTEKGLQLLLENLFKNTSVAPTYSSCRLTWLRPRNNGTATAVDIICTHQPNLMGPELDRKQLYWEINHLTHGATQLGPYTLDHDSLYVNGYTHPASAIIPNISVASTSFPASSQATVSATRPTAADNTLVPFSLNFTITNMRYTQDMPPSSVKFRFIEKVLQDLLGLLLNKTSIGPFYSGCRLASLRPANGEAATRVDMVCTYHADFEGHSLDRERLYWEMSYRTHGVTHLDRYTLDPNSLYVNGYTFKTFTLTTTTGEVSEQPFTLNFTIDNLRYSADMGHPSSLKFNITDTVMQHLLSPLFEQSSLGARYGGCRVTALRSVKNGAQTAVDILCTYRQHPSDPRLPTKQVFHELSRQTRGITRLGPYSLDKDSLYLNGYNERGPAEPPTTPEPANTPLPPPSAPVQPETTTAVGHTLKTLTLKFTISNFQYLLDMGNPGSTTFNNTERVLKHLLGPLLQKTSLSSFYSDCRLISLRPKKDRAATRVDVLCTYHPDPSDPGLDREQLYWELSQLTNGVTQLGSYTLERGSLSVNGYIPQSLLKQNEYQMHFRIINQNLSNPEPTSSEYITLLRNIQTKVTRLYKDSQLQDMFHSCIVTDLRVGPMLVTVKALFSSKLDSILVKQVFLNRTLNISSHWLGGTYQLVDLHVTEMEPTVHLVTDEPTSSPSPQQFQLNFTITNLLYSQDMAQPSSAKYQWNKRSIEDVLNQLFRNSSIKNYFSDCQVLGFRSVLHSSHTGVDSLCNFSPLARRLDRVAIYEEFLRLTQNGTQLQNFTLEKNSVFVDGYSPNRNDALTENSDLPFWAIILICLAGFVGLIICLICCFLVTTCLRKKGGDYEVQRRRLGYYLPHLDLQKLQ
ncbi:mucin-16-like [Tamandua tetradactyla]|uniref:mucin-16-like n=1 Tax=Tamandua tetradactyla TaxID=48850 RepID=UPI0040542E5A